MVTQSDHARLATEILRLWKTPEFLGNPRRDQILDATCQHDNGWQETDSAPRVSPQSGTPYDFRSLPEPVRLETWKRGCDRLLSEDLYTSLLVARHALQLLSTIPPTEESQEIHQTLETRIEGSLADCWVSREEFESDYLWLKTADHLALGLCQGDPTQLEGTGWVADFDGSACHLAPFPLAGTTRFQVSCRTIPDRCYHDSTDLTIELASARWTRTEFRLLPLNESKQ